MARTVTSSLREKETVINRNLHKTRKNTSVHKKKKNTSVRVRKAPAISASGDIPPAPGVSKSRDRSDEYFNDKVERYIERVYKFAAKYNVSATVVIAKPGSSEVIVAGVGNSLGMLKRRRQLYTFCFIPPNTNGKYKINMDVSKKLEMSESIQPTVLPSTKATKPSRKTTVADDGEVEEIIELETPEIPENVEIQEKRNDPDSGPAPDEEVVVVSDDTRSSKRPESSTSVVEVVAGPSKAPDVNEEIQMRMEAAMDTSCSTETIGLTKKNKLSRGRAAKKNAEYERKMPIPSSIKHKNKFKPPISKPSNSNHQI